MHTQEPGWRGFNGKNSKQVLFHSGSEFSWGLPALTHWSSHLSCSGCAATSSPHTPRDKAGGGHWQSHSKQHGWSCSYPLKGQKSLQLISLLFCFFLAHGWEPFLSLGPPDPVYWITIAFSLVLASKLPNKRRCANQSKASNKLFFLGAKDFI